MDDCAKETPVLSRRTRRRNPRELAGAEKDDGTGALRHVNVTPPNRRQKKAEKAARTIFIDVKFFGPGIVFFS